MVIFDLHLRTQIASQDGYAAAFVPTVLPHLGSSTKSTLLIVILSLLHFCVKDK